MSETQDHDIVLQYVKDVMETDAGKAIIWEILERCGIYSSMPDKFSSGQRDIGIQLIELLDDADLAIYPNLLLEKRDA